MLDYEAMTFVIEKDYPGTSSYLSYAKMYVYKDGVMEDITYYSHSNYSSTYLTTNEMYGVDVINGKASLSGWWYYVYSNIDAEKTESDDGYYYFVLPQIGRYGVEDASDQVAKIVDSWYDGDGYAITSLADAKGLDDVKDQILLGEDGTAPGYKIDLGEYGWNYSNYFTVIYEDVFVYRFQLRISEVVVVEPEEPVDHPVEPEEPSSDLDLPVDNIPVKKEELRDHIDPYFHVDGAVDKENSEGSYYPVLYDGYVVNYDSGQASNPSIITKELPEAVKYVPYSSIVATDNIRNWVDVTFEVYESDIYGELPEVTILHERNNNDVIAEYNGVRCTAVYNPFVGLYYVDDIYGVLSNEHKCPVCGEHLE